MNAKPVGETGNGGAGAAEDYILIRDEKASGTAGGTFTSGVWQTRDLNVIVSDAGGHVSLASNQITLAAGKYRVRANGMVMEVDKNKVKLRNITDSSDIAIGTSAYHAGGTDGSGRSDLEGKFTIAAPKVIELQHRCSFTKSGRGFGFNSSFDAIEVYATVEFFKEA